MYRLRESAAWRVDLVFILAAACAYFLAARAGLYLIVEPEGIASIWPASGLALGTFLLNPARRWPALSIGILIGSCLGNMSAGDGFAEASGYAIANAIEPIVAGWIIRRWLGPDPLDWQTPHRVLAVALVCLTTVGLSAVEGAFVGTRLGDTISFAKTWHLWFAADGLGILLVTPVVLALPGLRRPAWDGRPFETLALFATTGAIAYVICVWNGPSRPLILNFPVAMLLPTMLWAGLRFDVGRVAVTAAIACGVFCIATVHDIGPFSPHDHRRGEQIATVQVASMAWCLSGLTLAAAMTEQRRLRTIAEAANDAKSAFIANVTHDIRTPLSSILGFTQLMQMVEYPREERAEHLASIERSGRHLLRLVNDLLDLSKIEAGKLTVETLDVSLATVLRDVADLVEPDASHKGITFDVCFVRPVPATLHTDPTRLRQILFNLAGNAVKFTGRGGVELRCELLIPANGQTTLRLSVCDTGIGLTAEQIGRLFGRFQQAETTTARRFGGTGLGLSISQHLAELLGGRIEVESAVGVGSTFTLVLPGRACDLDGPRINALPSMRPHAMPTFAPARETAGV